MPDLNRDNPQHSQYQKCRKNASQIFSDHSPENLFVLPKIFQAVPWEFDSLPLQISRKTVSKASYPAPLNYREELSVIQIRADRQESVQNVNCGLDFYGKILYDEVIEAYRETDSTPPDRNNCMVFSSNSAAYAVLMTNRKR